MCEKNLKENKLLNMNETLYLLINVWNQEKNSDVKSSTSITNRLIKSSGEVVDTKQCGKVQAKMPPTKDITSVSTKYDQIKQAYGTDIFNSTDNFFFDLCITFIQQESDITLEARRNKFNSTIVCSEGCSYSGLDEDGYITCTCDSENINEVANQLKASFVSGITSSNIMVITCFSLAFNTTIMKTNLGFWLIFGITTLIFLLIIIFHKCSRKDYIKKN